MIRAAVILILLASMFCAPAQAFDIKGKCGWRNLFSGWDEYGRYYRGKYDPKSGQVQIFEKDSGVRFAGKCYGGQLYVADDVSGERHSGTCRKCKSQKDWQ